MDACPECDSAFGHYAGCSQDDDEQDDDGEDEDE
jgi:hypothetical protein